MRHHKTRTLAVVAAFAALGLATIALRAYADVTRVVMRSEMDLTGTIATSDCPDINPVFITGGILLMQGQSVLNQNSVHVTAHISSQGVSGFDVVTGASYRVIEVADAEVEIDLDPVTLTGSQSVEATAMFVGQGSAPNENAHVLVQITVNADGTLTANVGKITIDCQ